MRKIISILVALGLVLAFSVVAMPATTGAAVTCGANVTLSNDCAGKTGVTYTIDFVATKTLLAGNDKLSFAFDAGTTFGTTVTVTVDGSPVPAAAISKAAPNLNFVVQADIVLNQAVQVIITGITNPSVAGAKTLTLDYEFACCGPEDFDCANYTIKPALSTYDLVVDFGDTYPGIAVDFVPPFKACGQNDTGADFNTTYLGGVWYDQFDLNLVELVTGCAAPCANATLSFNVTAFPTPSTGAVVSLNISGEGFALTPAASSGTLAANITLVAGTNVTLASLLHFNLVGEYTICFKVECPGTPGGTCPICEPGAATTLAEKCYDFNVHQWKDAGKMILDEKWNLISLPLVPFDTSIDVLLASLDAEALDGDAVDDLISIWSYDTATAVWTMYDGGGLTDMVDGAGYWARMSYPDAGNMPYNWWVWGTAKAMPPAAPSAYAMAAGWNMFGFTSLSGMTLGAYLWNFGTLPLVYGWDNTGDWTTSGWDLKVGGDTLVPGQGYWGYFTTAGTVVPP